MLVIVGLIGVFVCVLGGYMAMGGKLGVLFQPFELVIIGGAGVCAFMIANPKNVIGSSLAGLKQIFKGAKYKKEHYLELLTLQYQVFKLAKSKGMLALEQHVEKPSESALFSQFPLFQSDHHAQEFLCDYLRLLTLGTDNPHEVEAVLDAELNTHHEELHAAPHSMQTLADSFPALGIVAAVLGVIKTMGAITEPPEVLGDLIGAALVGTFLGILLSYGYVGPIASHMKFIADSDAKYYECMRVGLLAYLQGYAPAVAIEFARKTLEQQFRPTFAEVEEATQNLPPV